MTAIRHCFLGPKKTRTPDRRLNFAENGTRKSVRVKSRNGEKDLDIARTLATLGFHQITGVNGLKRAGIRSPNLVPQKGLVLQWVAGWCLRISVINLIRIA